MYSRSAFIAFINAAMAAAVLAGLGGCGTTPHSRFYLLEAVGPDSAGDTASDATPFASVGIRRVDVPAYLARNEIVLRRNGSELERAPLHRWAEPLRDSIPRVLAENISTQLGTGRISIYPWPGGRPPEYEISMTIIQFDVSDGRITLIAHWQLVANADRGEPVLEKSRIVLPVSEQPGGAAPYNRIVTAHSRALAELSARIVDAVRDLEGLQ